MASSSSTRCGKKVTQNVRNANPNGWISDHEVRYKFSCYRKLMVVVPHNFLNLKTFINEGFLFQEWIAQRGLAKFIQMTSDCYPDLAEVFYAILNVVNGVIHSWVKCVDIKIDDEMWLSFTGLKAEGYKSRERNSDVNKWTKKKEIYKDCLRYPKRKMIYKLYLHDGMKREEKMYAFILAWVLLPGRYINDRLTTEDVFLLHAIKTRIPTN